jgi:hypothetical protein
MSNFRWRVARKILVAFETKQKEGGIAVIAILQYLAHKSGGLADIDVCDISHMPFSSFHLVVLNHCVEALMALICEHGSLFHACTHNGNCNYLNVLQFFSFKNPHIPIMIKSNQAWLLLCCVATIQCCRVLLPCYVGLSLCSVVSLVVMCFFVLYIYIVFIFFFLSKAPDPHRKPCAFLVGSHCK